MASPWVVPHLIHFTLRKFFIQTTTKKIQTFPLFCIGFFSPSDFCAKQTFRNHLLWFEMQPVCAPSADQGWVLSRAPEMGDGEENSEENSALISTLLWDAVRTLL